MKAWLPAAAILSLAACRDPVETAAHDPTELYLWVWQRTEDLSFIDPADTKVALWIATITLHEQGVRIEARENPVLYPAGTEILPVIRLETDAGLDASALRLPTAEIAGLVAPWRARELQLDFDATESQRILYRRLLEELRAELPAQRLSITALASWCYGDPWIGALPIDTAVPMYYRMGQDGREIRHYLSSERQASATICRDNAGYSLDEPEVPPIQTRRLFLFSPEPWNEQSLEAARTKLSARSPR